VVEEGPWYQPDQHEPFSLDEFVARYRHQGPSAALGNPSIVFAEGRGVGGSTEINSGLYHRLPEHLAADWRRDYAIADFDEATLDKYAAEIERTISVERVPGTPPLSSATLARGADELGWRSVEFARLFAYDTQGRGTKQSMSRTLIPRAVEAGALIQPDTDVTRITRQRGRATGARARVKQPDGSSEVVTIRAEHVFVCGGSIQSPSLLQRSGYWRNIGNGLKFHPTVKIAARFTEEYDHDQVPMHRVTEFSPFLTIGGSASRRGQVALAIADAAPHALDAVLEDWQNVFVYYAAIRSTGSGRVVALPGLNAPLVTYSLTDADMSRLARGMVHLGAVLLAAGAVELYPSITAGTIAHKRDELDVWWDELTRARANLMTVHLTSTVRMGEDRTRTGADSFGRVWGVPNLRVNDGSLLPDAPGVNPQAAIMAIAARNADQFLSEA
jgi:choline dehydrogenase-like flavoprotein